MNTTDEDFIEKTQILLSKVVKNVSITRKLLQRPPFKYIHDILNEIITNTNFLNGLYSNEELNSENIKNKEFKINFLQKAIDALGFIMNKSLNHIKPTKIVAGLEIERTNEFFQILAQCVIDRKNSLLAVKRVLKGEKPLSNNLKRSPEKNKEKKSSIGTHVDIKDQKTKQLPLSAINKLPKDLYKTNSNLKSIKVISSKKSIDIKKETKSKILNKNPSKTLKLSEEIEKNHFPKTQNDLQINQTNEGRSNLSLVLSDSKNEHEIGKERYDEGTNDQKVIANKTNEESRSMENGLKSKNIEQNSLHSALPEEHKDKIITNRLNEMDKVQVDKSRSFFEKQNLYSNTIRPITATRLVTARTAPPTAISKNELKKNQEDNLAEIVSLANRPNTAIKQSIVNNLIQEKKSLDQKDENESSSSSNDENVLDEVNLNENTNYLNEDLNLENDKQFEKGSLVKKLIESKLELENSLVHENTIEKQTNSLNENSLQNDRYIERLKDHIQSLTKFANPINELLDHLQVDIDLMVLEDHNWLNEQKRNEKQLNSMREQLNNELIDLNNQISKLEEQINVQQKAIQHVNVNLIRNQAKLTNFLRTMVET